MPGPRAASPALREIAAADHLTECQHPVVAVELIRTHLGGLSYRTVVRVVEEQGIPAHNCVVPADPFDQRGIVPLVDQDQLCSLELMVQVDCLRVVWPAPKRRIVAVKAIDGTGTMFGHEVLTAPGVAWFQNRDIVAPSLQLGHDPPEEVGIAMVPIGHQGVVKHHDAHATTPEEPFRDVSSSE